MGVFFTGASQGGGTGALAVNGARKCLKGKLSTHPIAHCIKSVTAKEVQNVKRN
jgi:hypothetical protein